MTERECTGPHCLPGTAAAAIAALNHGNTMPRLEFTHHCAGIVPVRPATDRRGTG